MKLFVVAFACACLLALSTAESNAVDSAAADEPSAEYLPPVADEGASAKLADDGYRYKTVRRLKYRQRREVSQEYLPPPVEAPNQEYLPPGAAPETKVADDGYRYKTVRKLKFRSRHRRDVSELQAPSNDYLPPVEVALAPELKTVVGDDGYRYKTVRRLKYRRHRREAEADAAPAEDAAATLKEAVDAAPTNEYLPPASEVPAPAAAPAPAPAPAAAAAAEESAPVEDSAVLAKDGYRYKTVRKIRYRYRH